VYEAGFEPETLAEAIVVFVPSVNMALHIPKDDVQILEGRIVNVEMGAEPKTIIIHAQTMTSPLVAGVPVKLYLIRERETDDNYYPIAIASYEGGVNQ
jgi:hypothetical protein